MACILEVRERRIEELQQRVSKLRSANACLSNLNASKHDKIVQLTQRKNELQGELQAALARGGRKRGMLPLDTGRQALGPLGVLSDNAAANRQKPQGTLTSKATAKGGILAAKLQNMARKNAQLEERNSQLQQALDNLMLRVKNKNRK